MHSARIARDPLARHLAVGLVLEPLDLAGGAAEDDDRARRPGGRPRPRARSSESGSSVTRARAGGGRAAADRRDQRQLVAGARRSPRSSTYSRLTRRAHRHRGEDLAEPGLAAGGRERVGDGRALGQLEREPVAAGALAQDREQANLDLHRPIVGASRDRQRYGRSSISTRSPAAHGPLGRRDDRERVGAEHRGEHVRALVLVGVRVPAVVARARAGSGRAARGRAASGSRRSSTRGRPRGRVGRARASPGSPAGRRAGR